MSHHALRRHAFRRGNLPARRGRGKDALAGAGADLLHLLLRLANGEAAVRVHVAVDSVLPDSAVCRGILDPHFRPVALQLFGDHHGQRRHAALPHLRSLVANQDRIIRIDGDPCVHVVRRIAVVVPGLSRDGRGASPARSSDSADQQAAGGGHDRENEMATADG